MRGDERDRGAVLAIVALSLGFLITITAITIDVGRLSLRRRDMQAIADVVALDMSHLLTGRTNKEILDKNAVPNWADELALSAERNDFTSSKLSYALGDMSGDTFVPNTDDNHRPTAVQITASDDLQYFFAPGGGSVSRKAVASLGGDACFSVGSFAAAIETHPSSLLPGMLNTALGATVVSYSGLANAQITLRNIAASMGFAQPSDLLSATVKRKDLYLAMADALTQAGDTADATVLQSIAASTNGSSTIDFGQVVQVNQGSEEDALDTAFNVLDIVAGSAFLANGNNAIAIPDLGISVPGLSAASASVKVIQAPQSGCHQARTSQIQMTLNLSIQLSLVSVAQVTITMDMASANVTLGSPFSCGPPALVNADVASSLVTTQIQQTILGVTTTVTPGPQTTGNSTVSFEIPPDALHQMKRSGSGDVGLSSLNITTLAPGVQVVLDASFPIIDDILTNPLFSDFAGLRAPGADVAVDSYACNQVRLEQ